MVIKIKIPKIKLKKPKISLPKLPKVKVVHVEADVEGDIKSPGKVVGNVAETAKDGLDGAADGVKDVLNTGDKALRDAKAEIDRGLTVLKAKTDIEAENFWRNIVTEFNYFFATVCGENSERKKWQRKYDQGEISATELEERTKDLPPEDECGAAAQWSSEDGVSLLDKDGVPSLAEPEPEPEVLEFYTTELTDGDLKVASITQFMEAAKRYRDQPIWPGEPTQFEISPPFANAAVRENDKWGDGAFGASRGAFKRHAGVDFAAPPGSQVLSPVSGRVERISAVYKDPAKNGELRAIVIKNFIDNGFETKVLYVKPSVGMTVGSSVEAGKTLLGTSQSLQHNYPNITDHVHIQIRDGERKLVPVTKTGLRPRSP